MKAKDLAAALLKHPELDVMQSDLDNSSHVWGILGLRVHTVEDDDEYPKDYNMPKGYTFIRLIG